MFIATNPTGAKTRPSVRLLRQLANIADAFGLSMSALVNQLIIHPSSAGQMEPVNLNWVNIGAPMSAAAACRTRASLKGPNAG